MKQAGRDWTLDIFTQIPSRVKAGHLAKYRKQQVKYSRLKAGRRAFSASKVIHRALYFRYLMHFHPSGEDQVEAGHFPGKAWTLPVRTWTLPDKSWTLRP